MGAHWQDDDASRRTALNLTPLLVVAVIYLAGYGLGHSKGARTEAARAALRAPADAGERDRLKPSPRWPNQPVQDLAGAWNRAPTTP